MPISDVSVIPGYFKYTLSWLAELGHQYYTVEYGPAGYAPGTGQQAGPFYPNVGYGQRFAIVIDSLERNTDYTFHVFAHCKMEREDLEVLDTTVAAERWYNIEAESNNDEWGYTAGSGPCRAGETARLFAYVRNAKCRFEGWDDGYQGNPRNVVATRDTVFTAIFSCDTVTEGILVADDGGSVREVVLSPNPTSGKVTVVAKSAIERISIVDVNGRELYGFHASHPSRSLTIALGGLPPAVYIVNTLTATGHHSGKLVLK